LISLSIDAPAPEEPPTAIDASYADGAALHSSLTGRVAAFVPLSRPGPEQTRIYTSLGFATFECGGRVGCGMFEYSRRHDATARERANGGESD
jgi:hypothetical protein